MRYNQRTLIVALLAGCVSLTSAQIPMPKDAPAPLAPTESARQFAVPSGFRVELIAAEPLIREPSGVCWDASGQMYVCELHGYNLEGQYDIEALNETGKLDRVVRRVQASEEHKKAAEADTYGTIKRLFDTDNDGRIDHAQVWADRLPPCLGICPAFDGLIVACHAEILFLADRDGDGTAEVRDQLFAGFARGPLERSLNAPQWGPDNWIYVGNGAGGGTIHGKYLDQVVSLPRTCFRIRADGTAIEPVVGSTSTIGHTFTESGDRFVISTNTPGIVVAPIDWRYLARNPHLETPALQHNASSDQRTWPTSQPHPWRTRRAEDPGFAKYYTDHYGVTESSPNGYFTSACSPLVYRDTALPGLGGQLLACEPAQNMVHRAIIRRAGAELFLQRPDGEQQSEFLTSRDPWFHAISLQHAPDGRVFLVDFYREIIEDYSAIPRYLQQQYGLIGGQQHGRIWALTHEDVKVEGQPLSLHSRTPEELVDVIDHERVWVRETARRLLVERRPRDISGALGRKLKLAREPYQVLNILRTLDGLPEIDPDHVLLALQHSDWSVRREGLRLAEPWVSDMSRVGSDSIWREVTRLVRDNHPAVRLQVALTLGESPRDDAVAHLATLAREHGNDPWMSVAILSSVGGRATRLLTELLSAPADLEAGNALLAPLCRVVGRARDGKEINAALETIIQSPHPPLKERCLQGLVGAFARPTSIALAPEVRDSVLRLATDGEAGHDQIKASSLELVRLLKLESDTQRAVRLDAAIGALHDVKRSTAEQLVAVQQLAGELDGDVTEALLRVVPQSTPQVSFEVVDVLVSQAERHGALLDALDQGRISLAVLTAVQRSALLDARDEPTRERAARLLQAVSSFDESMLQRYVAALSDPRDPARGERLFREKCGTCHQAHGVGIAVGPDLDAEFRRAEETIVRDVLAPSDKISAGFATYSVQLEDGQIVSGVLAAETPNSVVLRQAEGKERVVLRNEIDDLRTLAVSLMPDDLAKSVAPQELADVLAWLRQPPTTLVLVDENRELLSQLREGSGGADFVADRSFHGNVCLRVSPPQRYAARIDGWSFPIRENPQRGEFRYVRFAWRAVDADGAMIEWADNGSWPPAREPLRRYHAGKNSTGWQSVSVADEVPRDWTVVTRDLWKDFGEFTLTGFAPTAMGGSVDFDRIELRQTSN